MKRPGLLVSMMIVITCFLIGCSKKNDTPASGYRKPYAWVAGACDSTGYGMILFSADSGNTWVRQGLGNIALKDVSIWDIWAVDENKVWAVCSGNVILKTSDGGQTWNRIQAPANNASTRLSAISIVNKTNIWISGSGGTVYNSADNGKTWKIFDTTFFHKGLMQGIWAVTPKIIYVAGGISDNRNYRGFIGYTVDGGMTWDTVSPSDDYNKNEWIGVTSSGKTILVYGGQSHYLFSTDAGSTWKNDSVEAGGGSMKADFNHMIMLNPQTWWGAMDEGHVYLTTDGGTTWTSQQTNEGGSYLFGIDAWDSRLALVVGESNGWPNRGPILKSSNGGANWGLKKVYRSNLSKVSFIKP